MRDDYPKIYFSWSFSNFFLFGVKYCYTCAFSDANKNKNKVTTNCFLMNVCDQKFSTKKTNKAVARTAACCSKHCFRQKLNVKPPSLQEKPLRFQPLASKHTFFFAARRVKTLLASQWAVIRLK